MAMTVQSLHHVNVMRSTARAGDDMIHFDDVPVREEQSAACACPSLPLKQDGYPACRQGVIAQPLRPLHEVAIIGACCPPDFDVPADRGSRMTHEVETRRSRELQAACVPATPVLAEHPPDALVSVAATSPVQERRRQMIIARGEDFLGDDGAVLRGPAPDDGVERDDQRRLRGGFVSAHHCTQRLMAPLDSVGMGFDEHLVRAWCPSIPSRPGLARRVVADRTPQEVKPSLPVEGVQGMADPGLARFKMQSHAAEPLLSDLLRLFDTDAGGVQHHDVVRVDHDLGVVAHGERRRDGRFQSMQGDQGKQRRDHTPLRAAPLGRCPVAILQDTRCKPALDGPSHGRVGVELIQEWLARDSVERAYNFLPPSMTHPPMR